MRILLFIIIFFHYQVFAQDIQYRIILFGDAGESNVAQQQLLQEASELVIPSKTSVYFLGDNIYPHGMELDSNKQKETKAILASQFQPFAEKKATITFIAGNHDWDKSGKNGLSKIIAQERYINQLNRPNVRFLPQAGTSAVAVDQLSTHMSALMYDSEYWLFPHHVHPDSALSISVKDKFENEVRNFVTENSGKTLLILSHHPMLSFGEHGYNFTWKDHLFPLTRFSKNLFLPLPILGSIYPLLRRHVLATAEDMTHKTYRTFVNRMTNTASTNQNVIFISGHDHGLQFIQKGQITQIISGSGSKRSFIAHNKSQKYVSNEQGFCVLDCLSDKNVHITFYSIKNNSLTKSFESIIHYKN